MQQATSAHSATGTLASSGKIENHSATRRGFLGSLAVLPAVAAIPALAATLPGETAVMAAARANAAAEAAFSALPNDLETTDPATHAAYEDAMLKSYEHCLSQTPENWADFATLLSVATDEGEWALDERHAGPFMRHARRLLQSKT